MTKTIFLEAIELARVERELVKRLDARARAVLVRAKRERGEAQDRWITAAERLVDARNVHMRKAEDVLLAAGRSIHGGI